MRKISALLVIVLVLVVGFFIWWQNGMKAPDPENETASIFVINKGTAIRQVGNDLKEQGFIKDPVIYFLYLKKEGIEKEIQAGSYRLSPSMTLPQVLDALQHGTIDVWVTIPEGYRAEEIAEVLESSLSSYDPSWVEILKENEGYLFPDTYLVPHEADIETIVSIMRNNFNTKVNEAGIDPDGNNVSDIIILASLIERESITDEEKPTMAGVFYNRLNIGMALQVDATIQYAKGRSGSWWEPVTIEEYQSVNSPYNTYLSPGLPPGPIANPGIESIRAASNPEESSYFYYIHENGNVHFAETLEGHNRNVDEYLN